MLAIPGDASQLIISCNYDPTGLATVDLFDNPVIGWLIDETATDAAVPIITGMMPPEPAGTAAIRSPQWAHVVTDDVYVPDIWRGGMGEFFTWVATNNGATRKVRGNFRSPQLKTVLDIWASNNPEMFNPEPF